MEREDTDLSIKRGGREWTFTIKDIVFVASIIVSAAGLYAHDEVRMGKIETKIEAIDSQNLPPRVSSLESQTKDLRATLQSIDDHIVHLTDILAENSDRK